MKHLFILFVVIILNYSVGKAQPIIVVDGFFLNIDSSSAVNMVGIENIDSISFLYPDSATRLIGEYGRNGLLLLRSKDPKKTYSRILSNNNNLLFPNSPKYMIDSIFVDNPNLNLLDPNKIISIEIISPLTAIKLYGQNWIGGIISIKLRK